MTHMALNKPGRCRKCGKPYTSTQHMRECRGMTIHQRKAARSRRAAIQRASRHRAGNIFAGPMASASYYDDARTTEQPAQEQEAGA